MRPSAGDPDCTCGGVIHRDMLGVGERQVSESDKAAPASRASPKIGRLPLQPPESFIVVGFSGSAKLIFAPSVQQR